MAITQCGPICDVDGQYILLDNMITFDMKGFQRQLHAHEKCKVVLEEMVAKNDHTVLPEGPLRKAIEASRAD